MEELRARAQTIWARLQAAEAAQASAAAHLAGAGAAAALAPTGGAAAVQASTALAAAEDAFSDACRAVDSLRSQWDACVAEAEKLHRELTQDAEATAATIRGLEGPPPVPDPAVGESWPDVPAEVILPSPPDAGDSPTARPTDGVAPAPAQASPAEEGPGLGTRLLDGGQTVLDVAGLVPGVGEIADGTNALIYLARGDKVNAALSAAAMVPFAGGGATAAKWIRKGGKAVDVVADARSLGHSTAAGTTHTKTPLSPKRAEMSGPAGIRRGEVDAGDRRRFVTTPRGVTFDIPGGWVSREADNKKGIIFQRVGSEGNSNMVRIMEPTPQYPKGYVRVHNAQGQPVDVMGKPGPKKSTHIPENYTGPWPGWPHE